MKRVCVCVCSGWGWGRYSKWNGGQLSDSVGKRHTGLIKTAVIMGIEDASSPRKSEESGRGLEKAAPFPVLGLYISQHQVTESY